MPVFGPCTAHLTVRWGASTLVATRVDLDRGASLLDGTVRVLRENGAPVLVILPIADGAEVRAAILPERKQRVFAGPFTVIVDTETDVFAPVARRALVGARALLSDGASLFLHAAVLLIFALLKSPIEEHPAIDVDRLVQAFAEGDGEQETAELAGSEGAVEGADVTSPRPEGAAGAGSDTVADFGKPERGPRGREAVPEAHRDRDALLADAASFGIISLVRTADARVPSPWDGDASLASAGDAAGIAWGNTLGEGLGYGGLGLLGIGEGAGGKGAGVAWGMSGLGGGGVGSGGATCGVETCRGFGMGHGLGRSGDPTLRGSHTTRPPVVRCGGGALREKDSLTRAAEGPSNSAVLNPGGEGGCAASITGRLPPEIIRRVVRQNFGRMRACYQPETDGEGRVSVRFVIGRDGAVASAQASGDGMRSSMVSCVGKAFQGISFPQPEGGVVTVTYPIVFSPL